MNDDENIDLLIQVIVFNSTESKEELDLKFREFYTEVRLINYISIVIKHYSRDYFKKKIKDDNKHLYIFDQPIKKDSDTSSSFGDLVPDNQIDLLETVINQNDSILEHVENPKLHYALQHITKKQLLILQLYFINNLSHKQIGELLGVSQQAISKNYKKALLKIKSLYKEEEEFGTD